MELQNENHVLSQGSHPEAANVMYVMFTKLKATFIDISPISNTSPPLLNLPQELKDRIYELVLGGLTFHVARLVPGALPNLDCQSTFKLCLAEITEKDVEQGLARENPLKISQVTCVPRHGGCATSRKRMDISLLYSCRQIYAEAKLIPLFSNTFLFSYGDYLLDFISYLSRHGTDRNLAVRSVSLEFSDLESDSWDTGLKAMVREMTRIKRISISLSLAWDFHQENDFASSWNFRLILKHASTIRILSLGTAIVIVENGLFWFREKRCVRYMKNWEKQMLVEQVKSAILDKPTPERSATESTQKHGLSLLEQCQN